MYPLLYITRAVVVGRDDATELTKELCCGVVGGRKWESRLLLLGLVGWMGWPLKDVDELLW